MRIQTTPSIVSVVSLMVVISFCTVSFSFGQSPGDGGKDKLLVCVSILPQAYFVEQVGGNRVAITVLVGPGQSPATYDPSPHDMAHLSDADVYYKIGVPFERRLLEKAMKMLPQLNVVDTRKGITPRYMVKHDPHPEQNHDHGASDPHTWLDPHLVKIQASNICNELKRLAPDYADEFDQNLAAFQVELDKLDKHISDLLAPYQGSRFYVFHPSYGYFADRYGLQQVAIEKSGKEPGARQLTALIEQAQADNIRAIFIQKQFSSNTAVAIAREIGGGVVILDPLARDYIRNLTQMAKKIAGVLRSKMPVESGMEGEE